MTVVYAASGLPGERFYETGIDRGVLYPPSAAAVPWNGLINVSENAAREVKSYYMDGVKFLDHVVFAAYSATLQAFTMPDELEALVGLATFAPGVFLHDQKAKTFSLSYRTKVGNDLDGVDHAYKIHIVYNVLAAPSGDVSFATIGDTIVPNVLEWSLTGTPENVAGVRPTSHVSLHSDSMHSDLLTTIETRLYGTPDVDPDFPDLSELLEIGQDFYA